MQIDNSGGDSDTDVSELAVIPRRAIAVPTVTTTTPVASERIAWRISSDPGFETAVSINGSHRENSAADDPVGAALRQEAVFPAAHDKGDLVLETALAEDVERALDVQHHALFDRNVVWRFPEW